MIDPRLLRDDPDRVRTAQVKRGLSSDVVDEALAADEHRRSSIGEFERLRSEQKQLGKQIAKAQKTAQRKVQKTAPETAPETAQKTAPETAPETAQETAPETAPETAQGYENEALLERTRSLSAEVKKAEAAQAAAEQAYRDLMMTIPNVAADEAPEGGEDDFVVLEEVGVPRDFKAEGFEPRDHVELGRILAAIDVERGAKVSGARFYYLTGAGADLELALVNMAMDQARRAGFTTMIPPALVKPRAMEGTGFLGQVADDVYRIEGDDMYLVGTSEVPLAAYHSDEILDAGALPLRYAAFSPCFRKEAGSYGKDTRGIIRVHWFDKVEMFSYTTIEESYDEHVRLLAWEKEFLGKLELAYRVIDVAAGDLGLSAERKFDCEAWIPTQGRYRELTSTSNCTDFQTRRLGIRGRFANGAVSTIGPIATLNGTLVAIPRTIVAILENHQQEDGSIRVPSALQPYLQGREVLEPAQGNEPREDEPLRSPRMSPEE